ncbi:MAG: hypothetical protein J3Q66DRAFT_423006 [Benniella sp.]|nr:MAG: hypothetical protein J3Q66DRAFT_423006 [Benniella sp.]
MDERPRLECESSLDSKNTTAATKTSIIAHVLKARDAALLVTDERVIERLLVGDQSVIIPSSTASNAPEQVSLPLSQAQHNYWRMAFAGAPAMLDLPTDRPRTSRLPTNGSRIPILLEAPLTQSLRKVAAEFDMDLSVVVLVGWGIVLARLSNQDDVVLGHHNTGQVGSESNQQADNSSILPLLLNLSNEPNISQLLEGMRKMASSSMGHRGFSLDSIDKIVGSPIFRAAIRWSKQAPLNAATPLHVDLELQLQEQENEVIGGMLFSSNLFDFGTIKRHVGYLKSMLQSMVVDVNQPVTSVDLISQDERDLVLGKWNETQQDYPAELCIHHLFEQQVEHTPQATALVFNGQSMTYAELNERSNRLAYHLIELGVQPDSLVAICVERSFATIIGVLAILKAGGAYVPLDPAYASNRLKDILADASPCIAIVDAVGRTALGEAVSSMTVVNPNDIPDTDRRSKTNPQVPELASFNLAYIIYTSGSTGKPKGVMIEHRGVVNLIHRRPELFGISTSSRVVQFTSLNFDHSVSEIFSTLTSGASLHLIQDDIRLDQHRLWDYLKRHSITHVSLTPALLQSSKDIPTMDTVQLLIIMGEALPAELVRSIQPLVPRGSILNSYGPTEITVSAITWKCPQNFMSDIVPIGRPIANKTIYLLDKHQQPVPLGAVGELYIGGTGVGRGYLKRSDLTAKVFLPDPFSKEDNARMYKTGDLARYLADGNIVFLGRNDHQVKIRGFRIELGEIEARLVDHPLVDKAVVITIGEGSDKRLVGYVVAKPDDNLVNTLRSHLMSCLPDYMVPAAIVRLESLPINNNGKIDRKALPIPDSDAFAREIYEEPQGEVENTIAKIWAEVLKLDRVSRNDNFFALGGHSLVAVRLMNRVASLGIRMPLSTIFVSPTLSSFAESASGCMDKGTTIYPTIHPLPRGGDLPLSSSQQRMWFLSQMDGVSETYHIPKAVRLHGDLNRDAWERALHTLYVRHEALRSVFVAVDGQPQVRLSPAHSRMPIRWEDLRSSLDAESQLEQMKANEVMYPFDLEQGPLIRVLMVQLDSREYVFMVTQHHIVSDGWSSAIFNRELSTLYSAFYSGKSDPLPPLSIQYPDYAAWQKQWLSGERLETHTTYWKKALTDAPVLLDLPTDRPRPSQQSFSGDNIPIQFDPHLTRALKQLCQENGVTLYMAILAAWSCVLSRMSGQDDIVIGSPSANRNHHQIESLIGFFVNTLALRIDLSGDPTVRQLLERVRKTSLDAQNHQDFPFEQVVDIVQPPRSLSHSPLFQVMFALQNNELTEWHLPNVEVFEFSSSYKIAKFDLCLALHESNNGIAGSLSYSTALFDRATMERHVGYLYSMLHAMVADLDQPVTSVSLISQDERDLVLGKWNETQQDYPAELCIHHLFEQQAERTPQATALVFNGQSMTYAELNERSNRLAYHLIELGVQPDNLVAICVDRSFAMAVGVLAILKAGGAYVPLDPVYASERLCDILVDASPHILIADCHGQQALGEGVLSSVTVVDPDTIETNSVSNSIASGSSFANPRIPGLNSSNLAYIIYTSGSTGKPKGVMIEHHGMSNLVMTRHDIYRICASSRVIQFFSFAFDGCVMDIFSTLCSGASLHILSNTVRYNQRDLWEYLDQNLITQALLPPAIFQGLKDLPQLRTSLTLILGGESLPAALIQELQPLIPNGRIVNDYGPTEATVSSIAWRCPQGFSGELVPIGRPISNKRIYILDEHRKPSPLGAIGELYIGGAGVGRGYLNRPDLTAKVFLPDPFAGSKDARMYKTGDLARYLADGNIVFLGRNDHQVKIRGFRIELGEIEARLVDHPLVDKAVVITIGEGSDKRLVGYVVAKPDDNLVNTLRSHLMSCLPDYMVPVAFVRLDELPLSVNGKLDRHRLPQLDRDAMAFQPYEPPQGSIETALMAIWLDLLHVDRIGRHDNFFMLGGHSLLAVRMVNQIRLLMGFKITLGTLFMAPTIAELVPHLFTAGNSLGHAFDASSILRSSWIRYKLELHRLIKAPASGSTYLWSTSEGLFRWRTFATTLEDMAFDYIEQVRQIQPHGPYNLLGYSFGGRVVHTMAAHLERQGERVALLAVMDTIPADPMTESQVSIEDLNDDTLLFVNRVGDALSDSARPYIERFRQVRWRISQLSRNHTYPKCNSDMVLFRAMVQRVPSKQPISSDAWKHHVMGEIEVFDIDCAHLDMDQPAPLAEIGGVLALRLNEIHTRGSKEL